MYAFKSPLFGVVALLLATMLIASRFGLANAGATDNFVANGDLIAGSGNAPDKWRTAGWKSGPDYTTFVWNHPKGAPGEIEVVNAKPNDSYWAQTVHLAPGWYRFNAEVKAEDIPTTASGANISITEDGITSPHLHGTTDWQSVEFYLKVGKSSGDVNLACRLGGFASLNTGKAFCRNINAVAVDGPPQGATSVYDLDVARGLPAGQTVASSSSLPAQPTQQTSTGPSIFASALIRFLAVAFILVILFTGRKIGGRFLEELNKMGVALAQHQAQPHQAEPPPSKPVEVAPSLLVEPPGPVEPTPPAVAIEPKSEPEVAPAPVAWSAGGTLTELSQYQSAMVMFASVAAVVFISALAIRRLDGSQYGVNIIGGWAGLRDIIGTTLPAALKLWLFWAVSAAVTAGLVLQSQPEMELSDAVLVGAAGVWVVAYVLGQLLGPIGLFNGPVLWLLLVAGAVQIWRKPPRIRIEKPSPGLKLAFLALGLVAIGVLPMQLGSPLVPYMDVLSYPASVQRILSFGVYLPFDNDPYGSWGPRAQTPGLELFLAMLALGARVKLGVLAQSQTMLPMVALVIFATYRLGKTWVGDVAGGMASILLSLTIAYRRIAGVRGTAVDFAILALGLAFFLDRRRDRTMTAFGAILLGTSVAVHAIDGGLAMLVASGAALLWLAQRDYDRFLVGIGCLAGAAVLAFPELVIGTGKSVPYPVLPISQLLGIAIIVLVVRRLKGREERDWAWSTLVGRAMVVALIAIVAYEHATFRDSIFEQVLRQYPLLYIFAFGGLLLWAGLDESPGIPSGLAIAAFALMLGNFNVLFGIIAGLSRSSVFQSAITDIGYKLDEYWCPYFLVFPAAMIFALPFIARERWRPVVVAVVLTILIYPWYPRPDTSYDYYAHSMAEEWGIGLNTAANGFWSTTHDRRWTLGSDDAALVNFLIKEQASGRANIRTHILHIANDAAVMGDFNRFSVFTGINDDPVVPQWEAWFAGSRVRPTDQLTKAELANKAYVLEQTSPPSWMKNPPEGFEEVFHQGDLRLYRRKSQ